VNVKKENKDRINKNDKYYIFHAQECLDLSFVIHSRISERKRS